MRKLLPTLFVVAFVAAQAPAFAQTAPAKPAAASAAKATDKKPAAAAKPAASAPKKEKKGGC
jgi:hypothetical protein